MEEIRKHLKPNYDSGTELILYCLVYGKSLKKLNDNLISTSKELLKKAKIVQRIEHTLVLKQLLAKVPMGEINDLEMFVMHDEIFERYEIIIDDTFIVSAFENYAKAILLKKGYMIHAIDKPNELKKKQKVKPIHKRTILSKKYSENYYISHNTIGISTLLKPNYINILKLSDDEVFALEKCRKYRNKIHFRGPTFHTIEEQFLIGISQLKTRILT
jgi:hypothetical protein